MEMLKKYSLAGAIAAMVAMPVTPVSAAEINVGSSSEISMINDGNSIWLEDNSDGRRRYGRHRRGISGGDILVGAAILGTIAVIAGSSNKSNRRSRDDYPPQRVPQNFPQQNQQQGGFFVNDIGSAVNACSDAALQSAGNEYQVNQISSVSRDGQGWRVDGNLIGPDQLGFACGVNNGGVQFIQLN